MAKWTRKLLVRREDIRHFSFSLYFFVVLRCVCATNSFFFVKFRYRNTVSDLSLKGYVPLFLSLVWRIVLSRERKRDRGSDAELFARSLPGFEVCQAKAAPSRPRVIFCEYCLLTILQIGPLRFKIAPDPGPIHWSARCDCRSNTLLPLRPRLSLPLVATLKIKQKCVFLTPQTQSTALLTKTSSQTWLSYFLFWFVVDFSGLLI